MREKSDSQLMNIAMKSFLRNTRDFAFVKNVDLLYVGASEAFAIDCVGAAGTEELIGKNDFEIFEDQNLALKYRADDEKVLASGLPMVEYRESYPDRGGRKRFCLTTKYIILDEDGNPAGIFGQCHDITEQVELEQLGKEQQILLNRQEKIFTSLCDIYSSMRFLDFSHDTYFYLAGNTKLTEHLAEEMAFTGGLTEFFQVWMTKHLTKEAIEENKKFFDSTTMCKRMTKKGTLTREVESLEMGWIRVSFIPVEHDNDGNVISGLMVAESINEEKKREIEQREALKEAYATAKRANSAKTEFLSRVSHDIRTPMNGIVGMTAIAMAYPEDKERVQDCLQKISYSSNHLLTLINEVLDMSKIESGNIEAHEEEFQVSEFVQTISAIVQPLVEQKNHKLRIHMEEVIHEHVVADKLHIQQILTNILSNAVKYTPKCGQIDLFIREFPCQQPLLAMYEFTIQDNGIGMSEEFLKYIYEPFTREEDSRTNKILGTGLGMAIVMNNIKMLGGEIKIESKKGEGSKFIVTIHMKINESIAEETENEDTCVEENDSINRENMKPVQKLLGEDYSTHRVLIVEDQELNREIARTFLEMTGVVVEEAENGLVAVNMIEKSEEGYYDFVFMDVQMPVMNGYAATRSIRALQRNDVKNMPIVAMTASAFVEDINDAKKAGMDGHIAKPIDLPKFMTVLETWFQK